MIDLKPPEFLINPEIEVLCADADPEIFHSTLPRDIAEAKAYCSACFMESECLEYALSACTSGVWGGTTDQERRRIKERNARKRRSAKGSALQRNTTVGEDAA